MSDPALPDTADLERRLRRMKAVPLALLILMAVVFVVSHAWGDGPAVGYLQAFAEAAMVGALADWFAVVALFRHPLGLPIPHTAIIPRRKDALADNLADFVRRHFLTGEVVRRRLSRTDVAAVMADWLLAHRRSVAEALRRTLGWLLRSLQMPGYREFLSRNVFATLGEVPLAPVLGRFLALLARNRHHQELFTEALRLGIGFLEDNKETIRGQINRGSPWWMPGFIDDRIYDQMISRIQTQLLSMVLEPEHPLRRQFDEAFLRFADAMQRSSSYDRMLEGLKQDLLRNPVLTGYVDEAIEHSAAALGESLERDAEQAEALIVEVIERSARDLKARDDLRALVDQWLQDAAVYAVEHYGEALTSLISETVRGWDGHEAARRIELQVGRDLQFIRINGTLVGGGVGLLIHAATGWLA